MILAVFLATVAAASPYCDHPWIEGFDPRLDGGVEFPTDARLVVATSLALSRLEVVVTTSDGVPVDGWIGNGGGLGYGAFARSWTPEVPFAEDTTYIATAFDSWDVDGEGTYVASPVSATFTTGDGAALLPTARPVLAGVELEPWSVHGCGWSRQVTFEIEAPAGAGYDWVVVRDGVGGETWATSTTSPAGRAVVGYQDRELAPPSPAESNCFTPVLVSASGAELVGEELCGEPTPVDTADEPGDDRDPRASLEPDPSGCGCLTTVQPAALVVGPLGLVFAGARRRRGTSARALR